MYYSTSDNGVCGDIRQYWKPLAEIVPTKKGNLFETIRIRSLKRTVTRDRKRFTGIGRRGTLFLPE